MLSVIALIYLDVELNLNNSVIILSLALADVYLFFQLFLRLDRYNTIIDKDSYSIHSRS